MPYVCGGATAGSVDKLTRPFIWSGKRVSQKRLQQGAPRAHPAFVWYVAASRERILVETPYGVHYVSPGLAAVYALGRNAEAVRARGGRLVRVILRSHSGGDEALPSAHGNPQKTVHDSENSTNPPRAWEFKRHLLRGPRPVRVETI